MSRRVNTAFCGIAAVMAVGACTLTTNLDGYAGPEVSAPQDAGDAVPALVDATVDDVRDSAAEASPSDAYRTLVLSDAPVGYWRLHDTGSIAKDEVGLHDGAYAGQVQHVDGVLGTGAASFDAMGYVDLGNLFGSTGQAPFSLEVWASPAPAGGSTGCMIAKDMPNDAGSVEDGWAFYLGGDNTLYGSRWSSGTQEYASGPAIAAGVFSHVVMTYDGARIVVFIEAQLAGDLSSRIAVHAIADNLTIGASRGGTSCFFHGVLDEVAIYDKALTIDRIAAHYAAVR